MAYIDGIGGFFFRSKNPEVLNKWYVETLGIEVNDMVWNQGAGATVFAPFPDDTDYFSKDKQWMLDFRVHDLQGFIQQLKAKGVSVEEREEWNENKDTVGTFARIHDPEGNPIELWEPALTIKR